MKKHYAAVIYDGMNVIVRVEERPSRERAELAGNFFTRGSGWYRVVEGEESIDMFRAMINA